MLDMTENEMLKAELKKGPTPKRHWLVTAGVVLGVGVLAAGGAVGVSALNDYRAVVEQSQAAAETALELADQRADDAAEYAAAAQESADAAQVAVNSKVAEEEAAAAQAAAEAAAEAAKPKGGNEYAYGSYPSGTAVPFIASSDPENAAGGDYDVSACESNSASTVNGVPRCD